MSDQDDFIDALLAGYIEVADAIVSRNPAIIEVFESNYIDDSRGIDDNLFVHLLRNSKFRSVRYILDNHLPEDITPWLSEHISARGFTFISDFVSDLSSPDVIQIILAMIRKYPQLGVQADMLESVDSEGSTLVRILANRHAETGSLYDEVATYFLNASFKESDEGLALDKGWWDDINDITHDGRGNPWYADEENIFYLAIEHARVKSAAFLHKHWSHKIILDERAKAYLMRPPFNCDETQFEEVSSGQFKLLNTSTFDFSIDARSKDYFSKPPYNRRYIEITPGRFISVDSREAGLGVLHKIAKKYDQVRNDVTLGMSPKLAMASPKGKRRKSLVSAYAPDEGVADKSILTLALFTNRYHGDYAIEEPLVRNVLLFLGDNSKETTLLDLMR